MAGPVRIICPVPWSGNLGRLTERWHCQGGRARPRERVGRDGDHQAPRHACRTGDGARSSRSSHLPARAALRLGGGVSPTKKTAGIFRRPFASRLADWTGCRRRSWGCRAKEALRASGLHGPSRVPVARTASRALIRPAVARTRPRDVSSPAASPRATSQASPGRAAASDSLRCWVNPAPRFGSEERDGARDVGPPQPTESGRFDLRGGLERRLEHAWSRGFANEISRLRSRGVTYAQSADFLREIVRRASLVTNIMTIPAGSSGTELLAAPPRARRVLDPVHRAVQPVRRDGGRARGPRAPAASGCHPSRRRARVLLPHRASGGGQLRARREHDRDVRFEHENVHPQLKKRGRVQELDLAGFDRGVGVVVATPRPAESRAGAWFLVRPVKSNE